MTRPRVVRPYPVRLHIDDLIIDGAIVGDRQRIARAIERELERLITERGVPAALSESGAMPRLDGGQFELTPGAGPDRIGRQVARSVYRGLSR